MDLKLQHIEKANIHVYLLTALKCVNFAQKIESEKWCILEAKNIVLGYNLSKMPLFRFF